MAKLIDEVTDDEQLSVHEAKSLYGTLKQDVREQGGRQSLGGHPSTGK